MNKPDDVSHKKWRRIQVSRYLLKNPAAKGEIVQTWIFSQKRIPQPEATVRNLNNLIRSINSKPIPVHKTVKQNYNRPPEQSVLKWRRMQVQEYINVNQDAKGKEVKLQIQTKRPNPWPEVCTVELNQMIRRLRMKEFKQDYKKP